MAVVCREPTSRAWWLLALWPRSCFVSNSEVIRLSPSPKTYFILCEYDYQSFTLWGINQIAKWMGSLWTGWQSLIVQESSVQKANWRYIMAWQGWTLKAAVLNEKTLEMGDLECWCSWSQIRPSENHLKRARTILDIRTPAFLLHSIWHLPSELRVDCPSLLCGRHHGGGSFWFGHHLCLSWQEQ